MARDELREAMIDQNDLDLLEKRARHALRAGEPWWCNAKWVDSITPEIVLALLERLRVANAEANQLRVQLAGCGVAALDGSTDQEAELGDYGWSPVYADVLALRRKMDAARALVNEMDDLRKLASLAKAATPGPWTWDDDRMFGGPDYVGDVYSCPDDHATVKWLSGGERAKMRQVIVETDSGYYPPRAADAAFIAAADPTSICTINERIEKLRGLL